jgi:hypothetical protein
MRYPCVQVNWNQGKEEQNHMIAYQEPSDQQTREELMDVVIQAISNYPGTYKMLSARTGLSVSCINSIANGKTAWPRWNTFEILLQVLNLKLIISKRN